MIVNVYSEGNTIRITDSAHGYKVSAINHESFTDMAVKRGELNKTIYSMLSDLQRNIRKEK